MISILPLFCGFAEEDFPAKSQRKPVAGFVERMCMKVKKRIRIRPMIEGLSLSIVPHTPPEMPVAET